MENRITVTLTMSADEYSALAEVLDTVTGSRGFEVSQRQENAIAAFTRVRQVFTRHAEDSA